MSNTVTVEPTEFKNVRSGEITRGVRIYDDQICLYQNAWESIPDDDLQVLELAIANADCHTADLFDFVEENEKGIYIGPVWYEWSEIAQVFNEDSTPPEQFEG